MKITNVKSYLVNPVTNTGLTVTKNLLFLKIETDEGIDGWGESFTVRDREKAVQQEVTSLSGYMIGRNPHNIKEFINISSKISEGRGSLEYYSAVSGIEIALWDIVGKKLNTPVYNLLGGLCRDKIRVYANGWTTGARNPKELGERALKMVNKGFTAIKFYPFPFSAQGDLEIAYENVRAVREAVGSGVDILIDVWRRPEPFKVIKFAEMIRELNIYWYEEPVPSDNVNILSEVRKSIKIPVVTGECLYTKDEFRRVFERGAADIINPDVTCCGGILSLKEIAAMSEPYYVQIAPHNFNSTAVGLAATMQMAAAIPNFLITEYFVNFEEIGTACVRQPFKIENGYISVPSGKGLGIEIDEEELAKRPFRQFPARQF